MWRRKPGDNRAVISLLTLIILFILGILTTGAVRSTLKESNKFANGPSSVLAQSSSVSESALAKATQSPSGKVYGVSLGSSVLGWSQSKLESSFKQLNDLGVTSIRYDVPWSVVQPNNPNSYQWSAHDNIVKTANKYGLSSLMIIDYTPKWARPANCNYSQMCPPANDQAFADYASKVVERYRPLGVNVYEVWNEENLDRFWLPKANAKDYVNLLTAASAKMKSKSQDITILLGGMSPAGDPAEAIAPRLFLKQAYAYGAKNAFDAVAYHPYTSPFIIGQYTATNWDLMNNREENLRQQMIANGDEAKKIWITEYGAPTGGSGQEAMDTVTTTDYDHVSEEMQARMATTSLQDVKQQSWIAGFYWYTLFDGAKGSTDNESYFGIIDSDGQQKPAYSALRQALRGN